MVNEQINIDVLLRTFGEERLDLLRNELSKFGKEAMKMAPQVEKNLQLIQEDNFKAQENSLKDFQRQMDASDWAPVGTLQQKLDLVNMSQKQFNSEMRNWEDIGDGMIFNKVTGQTMDYGRAVDQAQRSGSRFQMQFLGIMFAGMAMTRTFGNLNAASREWVGMNEIMSDMMGIVTLGATLDLLQLGVLPLFDALTNLPEGAQYAIGLVTYALTGIGVALATGGQIMLGIGALNTELRKIGGGTVMSGVYLVKDKLMDLARYAAIGVTLYMAGKDIAEGEITAAVGDIMMASGFYWKKGWLLAAGVSLKIIGDEDIQRKLARVMISIADNVFAFSEWISDTLTKAFSLDFKNIDVTFFYNFKDIYREELDKMMIQDKIKSDQIKMGWDGPIESSENYGKKLMEITERYKEDYPKWEEAMRDLQDEYKYLIDYNREWGVLMDENTRKLLDQRKIEKEAYYNRVDPFSLKGIANKFNELSDALFKKILPTSVYEKLSVKDAIISPAGNIISTSPEDYLIATKSPENLVGGSEVILNVTYNINVSDKREMEVMLRKNNDYLKSEIRRIVKI